MIDHEWTTKQAVLNAICGAQEGEVVAIAPEAIGYEGEEFDGQTEIELRRELMRFFQPPQDAPDFEIDANCVGEYFDREENQTVYLLAQNTADRGVIYLVAPSSNIQ